MAKLTRETIFLATGVIIESLAETSGEAPEGHLYLVLQHAGINLDQYYQIIGLLVGSGLLVRTPGPQVKITDKGRKLAADMAQARKAQ